MHRAIPAPTPQETDFTKCRTSKIVATWLKEKPLISHCLNQQENCGYSMPFAYGCLCKHPRHLDFAATDEEMYGGGS